MSEVYIQQISVDRAIVFGGIKWTPLIGANYATLSQKEAASAGATHFVPAGDHSTAVGTVKLPKEKNKRDKRRLFSAAAIFAQGHSLGAVIATFPLEGDDVWVVAAHDGVVVKGTDKLCSAKEAEEIVAAFLVKHANGLRVDDETDPAEYLNTKSELQVVRTGLERVPVPVKVLAGVVLLLMAGDAGLTQWKKYKLRQQRSQGVAQVIDARAEWARALDTWAASVKTDGVAGLYRVFQVFSEIPMRVGGWKIAEGECKPSAIGWDCLARYERTVDSTNASFKEGAPAGWVARWDGINYAIGSWSVPFSRGAILRSEIVPLTEYSVSYISKLQAVLPAFRKVELAQPVKVSIPTPQVYQEQLHGGGERIAVPYPQADTRGIELPSYQAFKITGPLRSLSVLPLIENTAISKVRFVVEASVMRPMLRESVFTAEITGNMYVQ